jgi:phosphoribosyl 1,2-cyclic phosphodiesterase
LNAELLLAFSSCDALLIESNYDPGLLRDGPYPFSLKERILGPRGHLANADVARYLAGALSPRCQTVVLAHLSQKNNHPELVRMSAEPALARAGRADVRLELTTALGTEWIPAGKPARAAGGPRQLALF